MSQLFCFALCLSLSFCICLSNPCPIYKHISAGQLDYHSGGRLAAACTCWKSSWSCLEKCVCVVEGGGGAEGSI